MTVNATDVNRALDACDYKPVDSSLTRIIADGVNDATSGRNEAAMFLAQLIHESGGFCHSEEDGGRNQTYAPYYGRGYIQLTWDYNYRAASRALFGDENVLLRDPDMVSRDPSMRMRVSAWFWTANVRPAGGPAQNNFGLTTKAINGGIESSSNHPTAQRRYDLYKKVAGALGVQNLASNQY